MKEECALLPALCYMPGEGHYHPSVHLEGVCIEDGQVVLRHSWPPSLQCLSSSLPFHATFAANSVGWALLGGD